MKQIWQVIKVHPVSTISYFLYSLFWIEQLRLKWRYNVESKLMDAGNRLSFGEGVAYGALFTILCGIIFTIVILLNAAFRKGQRKFYLLLSLPIIVSILLLIFIIGI